MSSSYDVQCMFCFPSNVLSLIINTQSLKHNSILNPTIECFMLDYKYTQPSIKISIFGSKDKSKISKE